MRPVLALLVFVTGCSVCRCRPETDAGQDAPTADTTLPFDSGSLDAPGLAACDVGPDASCVDTCIDQSGIVGEGDCTTVLGYAFVITGDDLGYCRAVVGCTCAGGCAGLFDSAEACARRNSCRRLCGGLTADGSPTCLGDEYCSYEGVAACGADDSTGLCLPRPTDCPGPGGDPICGCDGAEYATGCHARMAGTDVAMNAPCP